MPTYRFFQTGNNYNILKLLANDTEANNFITTNLDPTWSYDYNPEAIQEDLSLVTSPISFTASLPRNQTVPLMIQGLGEGYLPSGGFLYNFGRQALTQPAANRHFFTTIVLNPGETLRAVEWFVQTVTTTQNISIGLYSTKLETYNDGNGAFTGLSFGSLLYKIVENLHISSTGDKNIYNLNYTAKPGETAYNTYFVVYCCNAASMGHSVNRLAQNNQLGDIVGGSFQAGDYYRRFPFTVTSTFSTLQNTYTSISSDTVGSWFFTYRKSY
jgi:hypothetical protein